MGREVRRVPKDWKHPTNERGFIPLLDDSYEEAAEEWLAKANAKGLQAAIDSLGRAPQRDEYMPRWTEAEATHLMMYENTSEGTPISPAFATAEELARWLADNKASAFGPMTADYEDWLRTIRSGWAPSAVMTGGVLKPGTSL